MGRGDLRHGSAAVATGPVSKPLPKEPTSVELDLTDLVCCYPEERSHGPRNGYSILIQTITTARMRQHSVFRRRTAGLPPMLD